MPRLIRHTVVKRNCELYVEFRGFSALFVLKFISFDLREKSFITYEAGYQIKVSVCNGYPAGQISGFYRHHLKVKKTVKM